MNKTMYTIYTSTNGNTYKQIWRCC